MSEPSGRQVLVWLVGVSLLLHLLQQTSVMADGSNIENFLGWGGDQIGVALSEWSDWRHRAVLAYLGIDAAVFVPIYSMLLIASGIGLLEALWRDRPVTDFVRVSVLSTFCGLIMSLVLIDQIENVAGLSRLSDTSHGGLVAGFGLAFVGTIISLVHLRERLGGRTKKWGDAVIVGIVVAIVAIAGYTSKGCSDMPGTATPLLIFAGCAAHSAKPILVMAAVMTVIVLGTLWVFGICLPVTDNENRKSRATLRVAILDVIKRTRYVLCALLVILATVLVMPQSRDIAYAVFAFPGPVGKVSVLAAILIATAALGSACWMWSRLACRISAPGGRNATEGNFSAHGGDYFARDWARAMGLMPAVIVVLLCGQTMEDSVTGQAPQLDLVHLPLRILLFAIVVFIWGGVFLFLRIREREKPCDYYNCLPLRVWLEQRTNPKQRTNRKYEVFWLISPFLLPIVVGVLMLLARLGDVSGWTFGSGDDLFPPFAIVTLLLSVTFWVSLFGWLSLYEESAAVPWIGVIVIAAASLQYCGLSDNHVVWPALSTTPPTGSVPMTAFTAALLVFVLAAYVVLVPNRFESKGRMTTALIVFICFVCALGALHVADGHAGKRFMVEADQGTNAPPTGTPIDVALAKWLEAICKFKNQCEDETAGDFPVYFVTAEGGGIRAAYWTALVLSHLDKEIEDFSLRTFSISGASGASIGAAVFRTCSDHREQEDSCVRNFGKTDLMSPIVGAWMFEDVLARLLPTRFCATPGCGLLSRAAWFEDAMETGACGLRDGLTRSRAGQLSTRPHVPYLLLNSTWVESGERAIASDLIVDWHVFPTAKDQVALLGYDPPLSTAAHNSARFPFVNPLGTVRAPKTVCVDRNAYKIRSNKFGANSDSAKPVCGHLADGGYADNSAGWTTIDVLNALGECLGVAGAMQNSDRPNQCVRLALKDTIWLRKHLRPHVLFIRNDVDPTGAGRLTCGKGSETATEQEINNERAGLGTPKCTKGSLSVFSNTLGVVTAAEETLGISAGSRLAAASQEFALRRLRSQLEINSYSPALVSLDLEKDGIRYPLGWHLSVAARTGMERQVGKLRGRAKRWEAPWRS